MSVYALAYAIDTMWAVDLMPIEPTINGCKFLATKAAHVFFFVRLLHAAILQIKVFPLSGTPL